MLMQEIFPHSLPSTHIPLIIYPPQTKGRCLLLLGPPVGVVLGYPVPVPVMTGGDWNQRKPLAICTSLQTFKGVQNITMVLFYSY